MKESLISQMNKLIAFLFVLAALLFGLAALGCGGPTEPCETIVCRDEPNGTVNCVPECD